MSLRTPAIRDKEGGLSSQMGNGLRQWLVLQHIPVWRVIGTTAPVARLGGVCTALGVPYHLSRSPLGGLRVSGVSQAEPPMEVHA